MKQFQFEFINAEQLTKELEKISLWVKNTMTSGVSFQIFAETMEHDRIKEVCSLIKSVLPDAYYIGASTNGNIVNGVKSESDIVIVGTVFEYPSTKVEVLQYELTNDTFKDVTADLVKKVDERPWVKGIEMLVTIRGMSMTGFCNELSKVRKGVKIFGGGAFNSDINSTETYVFSSSGDIASHSVVFVLLGGDDLFISTTYVTGWKPLGRELFVTKAKGAVLNEIDGQPAYNTYQKYLKIGNDEYFFRNTLEFPLFYYYNGINILRAPTNALPDGSLEMTADINEHVKARLAYGDPETILKEIRTARNSLAEFCPEGIRIYSCAARRTYWGDTEISNETAPFNSVAPTSGFFTSGEFMRTGRFVNQHNVTLVIAAMREGQATEQELQGFSFLSDESAGKFSLINRLANFIEISTKELEEANRRLEVMAVTDELTQVFNRREIQKRIKQALKEEDSSVSLIMLDVDFFKRVNDTYGHKVGDNVLKGLTAMLRDELERVRCNAVAGRWGGEEFMVLLSNCAPGYADKIAENIRKRFSELDFEDCPHQTISLGTAEALENETSDSLCSRVDHALYDAKNSGRNRVCSAKDIQ